MSSVRWISVICGLAAVIGCGNNVTEIYPPVLPHSPVNAAWKAVENLEYAYNTMDLELVEATLDQDFIHWLGEEDWADFDGDGTIDETWDLDLELEWFEGLFETADEIEMTFSGETECPWSGDPAGQALELQRTFCVQVYFENSPPYNGIQSSGTYIYICRPDSNNEWRIWQLLYPQPLWWP